jgi:hypothetical protein
LGTVGISARGHGRGHKSASRRPPRLVCVSHPRRPGAVVSVPVARLLVLHREKGNGLIPVRGGWQNSGSRAGYHIGSVAVTNGRSRTGGFGKATLG